MLSQYSTGIVDAFIPESLSKYVSHITLAAIVAIARYSTSVLDLATVGYFFALHEIVSNPSLVQYLVVDLLVVFTQPNLNQSKQIKIDMTRQECT